MLQRMLSSVQSQISVRSGRHLAETSTPAGEAQLAEKTVDVLNALIQDVTCALLSRASVRLRVLMASCRADGGMEEERASEGVSIGMARHPQSNCEQCSVVGSGGTQDDPSN